MASVIPTCTFSELPVVFGVPLEPIEVTEEETVEFVCETSKANVPVKWLRNGTELTSGLRYKINGKDAKCVLSIPKAQLNDNDAEFTCMIPSSGETTSASLTVKGTFIGHKTCFAIFLTSLP